MRQGLSLRVSQHLALTPQLQQSIRLLQLSTLELGQEIEQMLEANPFLEMDHEAAEREQYGLAQADMPVSEGDRISEFAPTATTDFSSTSSSDNSDQDATPLSAEPGDDGVSWEGDGTTETAPDDSEWGSDAPARTNNLGDTEDKDATELARVQESLQAHLLRQALRLRLSDTDSAALRFLIESLNDDGYLEDPLASLAQSLAGDDLEQIEDLVHHFTVALGLLHSLEPVGVGARDLGECLRLQVRALLAGLDASSPEHEARREVLEVALRVCQQPMDFLARRDIKRLVALGVGSDVLVRESIALIARLEPKPGRRFVDVERNIVVPDVLVTAIHKAGATPKFRVQLNPDVMPRLRVHDIYANVLRNHKSSSSHAGLQQRLQEARWFIKNIQQRFDTILRVSTAVVERQKSFFTHGELAMRPLVLREIAEELGLHESTISRVTTAKYMSTPFGTFELKYFFGSGLDTESGGSASSTAVRAIIKQFIAAENPKKPLSDNQLSEMLKEQGIECARRTVAKYREGLKIAPASLRKAL